MDFLLTCHSSSLLTRERMAQHVATQLAQAEADAARHACAAELAGCTAPVVALCAVHQSLPPSACAFPILTVASDGDLRLWDAASGSCQCRAATKGSPVWATASPTGGAVATATGDGTVQLWRILTEPGSQCQLAEWHTLEVR